MNASRPRIMLLLALLLIAVILTCVNLPPRRAERFSFGDAWKKTKKFSVNAWDKTKNFSEDAWDKTKNFSEDAWDKTKNFSEDAWDKTKNFSVKAEKKVVSVFDTPVNDGGAQSTFSATPVNDGGAQSTFSATPVRWNDDYKLTNSNFVYREKHFVPGTNKEVWVCPDNTTDMGTNGDQQCATVPLLPKIWKTDGTWGCAAGTVPNEGTNLPPNQQCIRGYSTRKYMGKVEGKDYWRCLTGQKDTGADWGNSIGVAGHRQCAIGPSNLTSRVIIDGRLACAPSTEPTGLGPFQECKIMP